MEDNLKSEDNLKYDDTLWICSSPEFLASFMGGRTPSFWSPTIELSWSLLFEAANVLYINISTYLKHKILFLMLYYGPP